MLRKQGWLAAAVLLLLLAAGLRFHQLEAQSFWNDEGNSARLSERSVPLIIEGTASDIHPPLYYLVLRGWRGLVGDSEFGLRAFSAFAGVGMVAVTVALGRGLRLRREAALLAGLFVAVNPALVYYSQEARMYALFGLLGVLSTWLLLRWAQRGGWGLAVAFTLVTAAGLYTHYFYPFVIAAQGVMALLLGLDRKRPFPLHLPWQRLLRRGLLLLAAALLLYLPWLPIFLDQFGGDLVTRPALGSFWQATTRWLLVGGTVAETAVPWSALWVGGGLVLLLISSRLTTLGAVFPFLLLPLLAMWITGTTGPAYYKFLTPAVPAVGLLLGGIGQRWAGRPGAALRVIGVLLLLALLPGAWQSLWNLYHDPAYARADYRAMAARITQEGHPNAAVILNAPNQWEAFTYYFADETAVYPLPRGRSRPQPQAIDAAMQEIAAEHDRIYAIFWGEAQRDPERLVERWLDAHAFKATDEWYGDVRFVTYAVPAAAAATMETAVDVQFGDDIRLLGYTLRAADLRPGDIVQVTLFWETAVPLSTRYKVFLHLLDEHGQLVAQRDSEPGGGLALTTTWPPRETVVDNHGVLLPVGLADGRYTLMLGLYDFADPAARLPVQGAGDVWPLAEIEVRR